MRGKLTKLTKYPLSLITLVVMTSLLISSCRSDEVDIPPLTGNSGARLFLTISAEPDHLTVKRPGRARDCSRISAQLKNQLGQGVAGQRVKFRILNRERAEVNIGSLNAFERTTDAGGFARVTYCAPNNREQPVLPFRIYITAKLLDAGFVNEVTAIHALDLEPSDPGPGCIIGPGSPIPSFSFEPTTPVEDEPVCFDAQETVDNGFITSFTWSFGDGSTARGSNVCHTFRNEGQFLVTLTVTDEDRNCASITQTVTVGEPTEPTCTIIFSPADPEPFEEVTFIADVQTDANVRSFRWNFGDGTVVTTSTNRVTHTFTTADTFNVILEVTDSAGQTELCQTSVNIGNDDPTCDVTVSPSNPSVGQTVNVSVDAEDEDGTITSIRYDFGDGTIVTRPGTDTNEQHQYTDEGTFTVTITVTDNLGATSTCTGTVTVGNEPPLCPVDQPLSADTTAIVAGESVTFTFGQGTDPDNGIVTERVVTGGSPSSCTASPCVVTYNSEGDFDATLFVTDDEGEEVECDTVTITVGAEAVPTVSIGPASVTELDAGTNTMTFTVTLSEPSATTVTVQFATTEGTAETPEDFLSAAGTVTFSPGDVSETINVQIVGDVLIEGSEQFTVDLSNVSANATIGNPTGTGTINDDTPEP